MSMAERCVNAIERLHKRTYFHEVLYKFAKVCYARNFICDFILGKEQNGTQLNLF